MKLVKLFGLGLMTLSVFAIGAAEAAKNDFVPVRSGITHRDAPRSAPNGLNRAEFNRYIDSSAWAFHIGEVNGKTDFSGNRQFYDERDFLVGRKCPNASCSWQRYFHTVNDGLSNGNVVRTKVWVHNNGRDGLFPANTVVTLDWSNPRTPIATITSGNAVPQRITDRVTFAGLPAGKTFQLVGQIRDNSNSGNILHPLNSSRVINRTATSVSFRVGNVVGCFGGVHILDFDLQVIDEPVVPRCGDGNLDAGEQCDDGNTVSGDGCSATCTAEVPQIDIIKTDLNTADQDGSQRNDTQTIEFNSPAVWEITVTNTGTEALRDVVINDAEAPNCNRTAAQTQAAYSGTVLAPGDFFTYTCQLDGVQQNTFLDGDNDIAVTGVGVGSGQGVTAEDPSVVVVLSAAKIDIDKVDNNPGVDQDGTVGNDTQTVDSTDIDADQAVFGITVTNTGLVDLRDVRVDDARAAECALTADQVREILTTGSSSKATISAVSVTGNNDDIFNVAEVFSYDCAQDGVRDSYTNTAVAVGTPVNGDPEVRAEDPTEVLICSGKACPPTGSGPSIALLKDDANEADLDGDFGGNDSQKIAEGDRAVFKITVTNTGSETLTDVVITDEEAPSCATSAAQSLAIFSAPPFNLGNEFDPGESFHFFCEKLNAQPGDFDGANGQGSVDGENDARVDAVSVVDGDPVNAQDPSAVVFLPMCTASQGAINLVKDDSTPGQADTDGNDTQTVVSGGTAEFTISVASTGPSPISNIAVTDVESPSCARSVAEMESLIALQGNNDTVLDNGEVVTYTCSQTNVTADFTNTAAVRGIVVAHDCLVKDDDSTAVVVDGGGGGGFCGDGNLDPGEQCDPPGSNVGGRTCNDSCGFNGGGGPDPYPSVGTCSFHPVTNAAQCTRRRPVEDVSDPLWQDFRLCREGARTPRHTGNGQTLAELCVLDWAEDQGLLLCGADFGGVIDPFADPSAAQMLAQCDQPVCENCGPGPTGCKPAGACPGCFHSDTNIVKQITSNATIAKGENVTYRIDVNIKGFNNADYEIIDAQIRVHDVVVPAESGHIWDRAGIIDGDDNATWKWCDENPLCPSFGEYFFMDLQNNGSRNYVSELNAIGETAMEIHYDMDSDIASTHDTAQIKNVAFGTVYFTYINRVTGDSFREIVGIGNNVCVEPPRLQRIAEGFFGASAQVNIIRPFVKARAGNAGYFSQGEETKAFGDQDNILLPSDPNQNFGLTLTDDPTLYTGLEEGNATDLATFQEQQDAFYQNLEDAADESSSIGGLNFTKVPGAAVYQWTGDLDVSALSALSESATFIINNGDVSINNNFSLAPDVFAAFIVRDGDLLIDKDVMAIDGLYLVEQGEIKSAPEGDISTTQLTVQGNMYGNLGHLLAYRRYIGTGSDIEPSIEINFDLRLLDHTPPMLEQFLGDGWREDIQG